MLARILFFVIVSIALGFNFQSVSGHEYYQPKVTSLEGILDLCEFHYEEYLNMGERNFFLQHYGKPQLRFCTIIYDHIIWPTSHPDRDRILIAEIDKLLINSDYVKDRHLDEFTSIPRWIKNDANLWIHGEIKDTRFAYGIRALMDSELINPPIISTFASRSCDQEICIEESDFVKYSITDNFAKDVITEKYSVEQILNDQVKVRLEIISKESRDLIDLTLDLGGNLYDVIKDSSFCILGSKAVSVNGVLECQDMDSGKKTAPKTIRIPHKFIYPVPLEIGTKIIGSENEITIVSEILTTFNNLSRDAFVAKDSTGTYTETIDKETGLVLSSKYEETKIFPVWKRTELVDTNIFEKKVEVQLTELEIPNWWKKNTQWFVDGLISDTDYLNAMEYLIGKQIIRV